MLDDACFEVGGEDQFARLRGKSEPQGDSDSRALGDEWEGAARQLRVRIGTLLKTDTVSFLLAAGASVDCGGVLFGTVPREIERRLLERGITGKPERVQPWLLTFYQAVALQGASGAPTSAAAIVARRDAGEEAEPLRANYESVVSQVHRWRSSLPVDGGALVVQTASSKVKATAQDLEDCLTFATQELAKSVDLPLPEKAGGLAAFRRFLRKILTRPLNLKRVNIFTLNYDTLVEQAADAEGVVVVDGFVGTLRRVFRPECYDQDLYFPAQTTEGRVHRFDRVAHLYKLHGSINWTAGETDMVNPYGISCGQGATEGPPLIYPTPAKYGETLGMPYAELFRRFASTVVRPQSTLIVIGFGFGDDHVSAIIRQALAVPSFTLVVVDPIAANDFVRTLKSEEDSRVWILSGKTLGTFRGFVDHALPDLREQDVEERVQSTFRALGIKSNIEDAGRDGE